MTECQGHFDDRAYGGLMPTVLIGVGAVLIVFTFLLAFTIFAEISALLGIFFL